MCEFIKSTSAVILGAIVAYVFGLLSFRLQRRWIAREVFHTAVEEQIAKIEAIDRTNRLSKSVLAGDNEDLFLEDSVPVLIAASRRVKRHISASEWNRLRTGLDEYKEYQTEYKGVTRKCSDQLKGKPPFSQTLHTYLERIDACIS